MKQTLCTLALAASSSAAVAKYGIDEIIADSSALSSAPGSGWMMLCLCLLAFLVIDLGTSRRRIKELEGHYADASTNLNQAREALRRETAERALHHQRFVRLWGVVQPYCDGLVSDAEFIDSLELYLQATHVTSTGSAATCPQQAKKE